MPISNVRHARARAVAIMVAAAVALLMLPTVAHASHVGTVSITPSVGTVVADVCGPFLVRTQAGTDPIGAVVDVEAVGTTPVEFCLPAAGVNPVLIDSTTGIWESAPTAPSAARPPRTPAPFRAKEPSPLESSRRLPDPSASRSSWRSRGVRTTTMTRTPMSPRTVPR